MGLRVRKPSKEVGRKNCTKKQEYRPLESIVFYSKLEFTAVTVTLTNPPMTCSFIKWVLTGSENVSPNLSLKSSSIVLKKDGLVPILGFFLICVLGWENRSWQVMLLPTTPSSISFSCEVFGWAPTVKKSRIWLRTLSLPGFMNPNVQRPSNLPMQLAGSKTSLYLSFLFIYFSLDWVGS